MFKVFDFYEGKQLIGEFEEYEDAFQVAREFIEETDGECDVDILSEDETINLEIIEKI